MNPSQGRKPGTQPSILQRKQRSALAKPNAKIGWHTPFAKESKFRIQLSDTKYFRYFRLPFSKKCLRKISKLSRKNRIAIARFRIQTVLIQMKRGRKPLPLPLGTTKQSKKTLHKGCQFMPGVAFFLPCQTF